MSDEDIPQDAEGEQASVDLNQGLKTCQAVVSNYRAMIADVVGDAVAGGRSADENTDQPD